MFIHFSLRLLAGLSVGLLAAGAGMFLAWFIYLFVVPRSTAALLSLLIVGAGIGAGIGAVVAWLHLRHNRRRTTLATAIMTTIAGSLGSYGGYGFLISSGELFVETDRLAVIGRPDLNPTVIFLIGATVAANVAMLGVAISSKFRRHGPR